MLNGSFNFIQREIRCCSAAELI